MAPGLPALRPDAGRPAARPGGRGRRGSRGPDRGHPGGGHLASHRTALIWDVADPAWTRVNFGPGLRGPARIGEGARPGTPRHRLVARPHRPARGGQGSAPWRRRPALRAGRSGRRLGVHPRRPPARPSLSTAQALPEVRAAVGAEAEVYVDGGLRNGTRRAHCAGQWCRRGLRRPTRPARAGRGRGRGGSLARRDERRDGRGDAPGGLPHRSPTPATSLAGPVDDGSNRP